MQETAHESQTQCYFYVVPAKNNMSLPQGCETISDLLEMSIFHGSSFFFLYHFDKQPVHKSFPANPALWEQRATASVLHRKAKGCLKNHWYC